MVSGGPFQPWLFWDSVALWNSHKSSQRAERSVSGCISAPKGSNPPPAEAQKWLVICERCERGCRGSAARARSALCSRDMHYVHALSAPAEPGGVPGLLSGCRGAGMRGWLSLSPSGLTPTPSTASPGAASPNALASPAGFMKDNNSALQCFNPLAVLFVFSPRIFKGNSSDMDIKPPVSLSFSCDAHWKYGAWLGLKTLVCCAVLFSRLPAGPLSCLCHSGLWSRGSLVYTAPSSLEVYLLTGSSRCSGQINNISYELAIKP